MVEGGYNQHSQTALCFSFQITLFKADIVI
jgi:hypothetical protein